MDNAEVEAAIETTADRNNVIELTDIYLERAWELLECTQETEEGFRADSEMFFRFFRIEDNVIKENLKERLQKYALEKCGIKINKFKGLLKAYQSNYVSKVKAVNSAKTRFTDQPEFNCGNWCANDTGVWQTIERNGEKDYACPHPVYISRIFKNQNTDQEKVELSFIKYGEWVKRTYDKSIIADRRKIVALAPDGIGVTSENAPLLVRYLNDLESLNEGIIPVVNSVSNVGWHGGIFLPYDSDVAYDGPVEYRELFKSICTRGDYQEWLLHVKELRKNPIARFIISASFASVLLEPLGALPFILHIHGKTGEGKTVSQMAAASVWGDPAKYMVSLNGTQNFVLKINVFLRSMPFIADELQTIKDSYGGYDKFIMTITQGTDRGRLKKDSTVDQIGHWHNLMIFSGEDPITSESSGGGSQNRTVEWDVSNTRIIENGFETANFLRKNYGFAGREFIKLLPDLDILTDYKDTKKELEKYTEEKQAANVAVIMLADYIAASNIFGEEAIDLKDILPHIKRREEIDVSERAYKWVLDWADSNEARFHKHSEGNNGECYGWKDENCLYVNKTILDAAMKKAQYNLRAVLNEWRRKLYIEINSNGESTYTKREGARLARYIKILL